ncbi:MAG: SDR family oxidoreductase [Clostridia bacterium]
MNKVVLVTGASSGIGREIAIRFAREGCTVYGTSRKAMDPPEGCNMLRMNVTSQESIAHALGIILDKEGRIDVLVNNAGMGIAGSVEEMTDQECRKQFDVNYFGCLSMIRQVLPVMIGQKDGHIVNISSVAGFISIPFQSAYSSSKFALEALSKALRAEVRPYGVKVTVIQPGDTRTGFTDSREICEKAGASSHYRHVFARSLAAMEHDEKNGTDPRYTASVVLRAVKRKRPPHTVRVGLKYKLYGFAVRIVPERILEAVAASIYAPKTKE